MAVAAWPPPPRCTFWVSRYTHVLRDISSKPNAKKPIVLDATKNQKKATLASETETKNKNRVFVLPCKLTLHDLEKDVAARFGSPNTCDILFDRF